MLVPEKKIFEGFYHIWIGGQVDKFSFQRTLKLTNKIWLKMALLTRLNFHM